MSYRIDAKQYGLRYGPTVGEDVYKRQGLTPEQIQTCSVSIAEEEVKGIGASYLEGHLVAWNYYCLLYTSPGKRGWICCRF